MTAISAEEMKEMQEDTNWGMTNCSKVRISLTAIDLLILLILLADDAMVLKIPDAIEVNGEDGWIMDVD